MAARGEKSIDEVSTPEMCRATGISRQRLYYLEQKGYLRSRRDRVREKEFRYYRSEDVPFVRDVNRYLDEGYRYRAAVEKARTQTGGKRRRTGKVPRGVSTS